MLGRRIDPFRALVPRWAPLMAGEGSSSVAQAGAPWMVFAAGGSGRKPVIRVTRRRRPTSEPGERERAEAPRREGESGQGTRPPTGGGSGSFGGGGVPTGGGGGPTGGGIFGGGAGGGGGIPRRWWGRAAGRPPGWPARRRRGSGGRRRGCGLSLPLIIILLLVLLAGFFICSRLGILGGGGGSPQVQPTQPPLTQGGGSQVPTPTRATPATPIVAATAAPGGKWLVMLYQDADDKVLEQDIYVDLNEAERQAPPMPCKSSASSTASAAGSRAAATGPQPNASM